MSDNDPYVKAAERLQAAAALQKQPEPDASAALEAEVARVVTDPRHPTRVAYDRVRADFPNGGEEARAAFHRYLREEKQARDAIADRRAPKAPHVDEKTGVPRCSRVECPKYARFLDRCTEDDVDGPEICVPAVRDMVLELDARKDAADPAFDEIIKLCGLAKTWEYPGQVVRDVEDALKKKDEQIAFLSSEQLRLVEERERYRLASVSLNEKWQLAIDDKLPLRNEILELQKQFKQLQIDNEALPDLHAAVDAEYEHLGAFRGAEQTIGRLRGDLAAMIQANTHMQACIVYARDRRGGSFDFDTWIHMVEHALDAKLPPGELENAQTLEAKAWDAVKSIRADRDAAKTELMNVIVIKDKLVDEHHQLQAKYLKLSDERIADLHVMGRQGKVIEELRAQLARITAPGAEPQSQCKWMLPDEDPDEGFWHCKLPANHTEKHVTEFGRGLDARWYLLCEQGAHTFVGDGCRDCGLPAAPAEAPLVRMTNLRSPEQQAQIDAALADEDPPRADGVVVRIPGHEVFIEQPQPHRLDTPTGPTCSCGKPSAHESGWCGTCAGPVVGTCACSPKYIEIAPGVHAKYCPLAGLPLSDGHQRFTCADCKTTYRHPVEQCLRCGGACHAAQ